jgi:hypothetical protein
MSCIYVIRCANQKYYVGRTIDVVSRFNAHARGLGSKWCAAHLPLDGIIELHPDAPFQELVITLKTMQKYGIENVRGGPWVTLCLSPSELETIAEMFRSEGFARKVVLDLDGPKGPVEMDKGPDKPDEDMHEEPVLLRKGRKWDTGEDADLLHSLQSARSLAEIAKKHQRTEGAIRSRLAHHVGLLFEDSKTIAEIASLLHLSQENVQHALYRKAGLIEF